MVRESHRNLLRTGDSERLPENTLFPRRTPLRGRWEWDRRDGTRSSEDPLGYPSLDEGLCPFSPTSEAERETPTGVGRDTGTEDDGGTVRVPGNDLRERDNCHRPTQKDD